LLLNIHVVEYKIEAELWLLSKTWQDEDDVNELFKTQVG